MLCPHKPYVAMNIMWPQILTMSILASKLDLFSLLFYVSINPMWPQTLTIYVLASIFYLFLILCQHESYAASKIDHVCINLNI